MGKYFPRYYKAFPLQKRKRLCLRGSATVCSPALNCPSRCTEMETSYSVQLRAQSSIVLLASNVTRLGSQCETDHCAHWRRLQLWVKRTDPNSRPKLPLFSGNGAPHSDVTDRKTACFSQFPAAFAHFQVSSRSAPVQAFLSLPDTQLSVRSMSLFISWQWCFAAEWNPDSVTQTV